MNTTLQVHPTPAGGSARRWAGPGAGSAGRRRLRLAIVEASASTPCVKRRCGHA
jgi:hypothetical protein